MGKIFEAIDARLEGWILEQPLFFVATAPSGDGHLNVSPKGYPGTFSVLGPRRVAYLDTVGSGVETIAHLRQNGRIVIMFCAFTGPPRIVRLHGTGQALQKGDPRFDELARTFDGEKVAAAGLVDVLRSVIEVDVTRVSDSCGYGVPLMELEGWRPQMRQWADNRLRTNGAGAIAAYAREKNLASIDGLPGLELDYLGHAE